MLNFKKVEVFAIYFFWLACVLDPSAKIYYVKFFALALMLAVVTLRLTCSLPKIKINYLYFIFLSFFFFLLPVYGLFLASIRGGFGGPFIDTSYITSSLYFICSVIYIFSNNLKHAYGALLISLRILSILIIISLLILIFEVGEAFLYFFVTNGAAYVGMRNYGGFNFYYLYFIVSPMLIILISHEVWAFLSKKSFANFALITLSVLALFLSGTRANMMLSLITPIFVVLWYYFGNFSYFLLLFTSSLSGLFLTVIDVPVIYDMFSLKDLSNSAKIGYLESYLNIFSDLYVFIFGQGFNAHIWSHVVMDMLPEGASKTELTYLEFIRVFGILGFVLVVSLFLCLLLTRRIIRSSYPWVVPGIFLYFFVSFTNPYIFSSNGMLIIGFAVALLVQRRPSGFAGGRQIHFASAPPGASRMTS